MMYSIACRRRAPLAYARALILRIHTSTESFIIQQDVLACSIVCLRSVRMSTSTAAAARVCAQGGTRYCKSAAHCSGTRLSSMPAQSSVWVWAK